MALLKSNHEVSHIYLTHRSERAYNTPDSHSGRIFLAYTGCAGPSVIFLLESAGIIENIPLQNFTPGESGHENMAAVAASSFYGCYQNKSVTLQM